MGAEGLLGYPLSEALGHPMSVWSPPWWPSGVCACRSKFGGVTADTKQKTVATRHVDAHSGEGRRVAYVLNFAPDYWHTDWGGYLVFFDEEGDIVEGFRPRFNALNLFRVPQAHSVTFVPPFAPAARFAISGWLLDK